MVRYLRQHLLESVIAAFILVWMILATAGVVWNRDWSGDREEMFAYSFLIPILLTSFFFGRVAGLSVALVSSLVSGSLAVGQPELLESPVVQRVLFQIGLFNVIALVTTGLSEREKEVYTRYRSLFDGIPVGLYRSTPAGQLIDANQALQQILGYPDRETLYAVNIATLYADPEERRHGQNAIERDNVIRDFEIQLRRYDQTVIWAWENARAVRDAENRILWYEGSLEDITERKRTEDVLGHQAHEMAALYETSLDINAQRDLPTLLYAITERAARLSGMSMGALYLMKPDGETLELAINYHLPQDYSGTTLRLGEGLSGRIAQTGQPMMVEDYQTWEGRSDIYADAPFHRVLGVPLKVRGKVIGVINVEDEQIGSFGEEQVRLVSLFADQAAIAVESARLLEEASRRAEQLAIINRIGLAITSGLDLDHVLRTLDEQCRQAAEVDAFFVALYDDKTGIIRFPFFRFQREQRDVSARDIRVQPGLTGYVIQTRQPLYLPDQLDSHLPFPPDQVIRIEGSLTRSFIGVPLLLRDHVIGILSMQSNRPNAYGPDDVRLLETIATQAAGAIENARLYMDLEQRVRERTVQLETSNKELEAFAYSVSHDLRAPLRGIDGWSQALLEDYCDKLDKQGQQYIERVRSEAQRMGHLIDDLLQLSRLTRTEMIKEHVDLSALAQAIAERLEQDEPQRQVDFIIQPDLTAEGDSPLLEAVLVNLLGNAFKFTGKRADARIEFGDTELQGRRVFFVRDNGVGFDMAYSQKLFGAFQRMHKDSEFFGTGVGLATVQRIIHRHGGRVWAEAELERGATFYFTLDG